MIMTTELYERMNKLCDARVMFDDEQRELEQAVYDAIVAVNKAEELLNVNEACLLYTSPSPRDGLLSRMPSSA